MRKLRKCPHCKYQSPHDNIARHVRTSHGDAPPLDQHEPVRDRVLCRKCIPPRSVSKANAARHRRSWHSAIIGGNAATSRWKRKSTQYAKAVQSCSELGPAPRGSLRKHNQHDGDRDTLRDWAQCKQALVGLILDKMYSEVVFPNLRRVRKALEPSQTYGELTYPIVSRLLADSSIAEDSLVVDLGSGVGNVVLQVVLAYGCRALGCELIEARHTIAQQLVKEGLQVASRDFSGIFGDMEDLTGRVELRQGDAFSDAPTLASLRVADLIICNNVKFPPDLLEKQISAVLGEMKSGAAFVSFARIVMGKLTTRKNVLRALNVSERSLKGCIGDCSWKHEGVDYWVYTKNSLADLKQGRP